MTGGERDGGRVPRDRGIDATLRMAVEGYEFISRGCRRHRSDVFETRLLLQRTICMRGAEAARLFYDTERFQRSGATPARVQKTLFGQGGVQGLDGDAHRRRKGLFMSLMTLEAISDLTTMFVERLRDEIDRWQHAHSVVVHDRMGRILCEAVCAWTGVPLDESELQRRVDDLRAMIESPAKVGPAHWRGRVARKRAERWVGGIVEQVRGGSLQPPEGRGLHAVAWHRDAAGELLDTHAAAVELLNVVRPTVAIDRFVTFAALALHDHPEWRERLRDGGDDVCERFVQEVRRFYPFFPATAARVRRPFDWDGVHFEPGRRVLLDLFGTDQDPRVWEHPRRFDPDRFRLERQPVRLHPARRR